MNPFDLVQSFIERCQAATQVDELSQSFHRTLESLGFRYFACGYHVDPLHPREAVMLLNYPRPWVETYSELQLHCIDPVFVRAGRTALPFFWDDIDFKARINARQRRILAEARRFGVAHGYTIPIYSPRSPVPLRASCSVIPDTRSRHPHSYFAVQLMAGYLFETAAGLTGPELPPIKAPELTRRERQCLELIGQGKTDWEIGVILGISHNTVHTYVTSAMRRFKVTTRQQAVVCALAWHQIGYGDVIRAQPGHSDQRCPRTAGRRDGNKRTHEQTHLIR